MALAVLVHIVFVELLKPGDHVTASESFGVLEPFEGV
jgi:glycine cleavage system H lipoate-binding protein